MAVTVFSRLCNIFEEAVAVKGVILRRSRRSNLRTDPSISTGDGEPTVVEPNASIRLVSDATDPDRALAIRVAGAWHYGQFSTSANTALLDEHLDGGANKHDATEIDYERADGSKKNISAGSDTVEAALTNLDDATGLLSSLSTTEKGSVVGALNEVVARLGSATSATPNGTGVTLTTVEGAVKRVLVTFTNTPMPLTDNPGVVAYASLKVLDLPEGYALILGAVANLTITKSSAGVADNWDGDFSLGTQAADNTNTLGTNEQNIIPSTPTPAASAGATTAKGGTISTPFAMNGSSSALDIYLNVLVDDADHDVTGTPCNLIVNGTLAFTFINLGDA